MTGDANEQPDARAQITAVLTTWPGVRTAGPGERGEFSFLVGSREVGHLHGSRVAHFSFRRELGSQLREAGRVTAHPITDSPSLGARPITSPDDVDEVIALMRLNYDRLVERYGVPEGVASSRAGDRSIAARER
ncbi:MAG TPA: luciferase family protein [Conexibacter sp.]|jgi:hypothetical protein